ncbi:MAG TPA: helix-turn-helix domain-containing protein [Spirochaetota bacterium]|nr:helix-turn-helix domain-containing protein [Spirochaetota bacterium]
MISTGIKYLDKITSGLKLGDNVVWQISNGVPIEYFTRNALSTESSFTHSIVYVNFNYSPHTVCKRFDEIFRRENITMIDAFTHGKGNSDPVFLEFYEGHTGYDTSKIICLKEPKNIASFMEAMNSVETQNRDGSFYVFDSLTGMNELWKDERAIVDFFSFTCPKLYDLNTIAYWILEKDAHSTKALAELSHITQIVLDVENTDTGYYTLKLKKLEDRTAHASGMAHNFKIINRDVQFQEGKSHILKIGNRIKELRKSLNVTQSDLAARLGMTPGAISQIENDLITPSLYTLVQLSTILKKPIEYFINTGFFESDSNGFRVIKADETIHPSEKGISLFPVIDDSRNGFRVFRVVVHQGETIEGPFVLHKGRELITVTEGGISLDINGESIMLHKGDSILLEDAFPESWKTSGDTHAELLYILF